MKYKDKLIGKINTKKNKELLQQDIYSAKEFKKGLDKGKLKVESTLFSGLPREEKIINKICTYLGLSYLGREEITRQYSFSDKTFQVVFYKVGVDEYEH